MNATTIRSLFVTAAFAGCLSAGTILEFQSGPGGIGDSPNLNLILGTAVGGGPPPSWNLDQAGNFNWLAYSVSGSGVPLSGANSFVYMDARRGLFDDNGDEIFGTPVNTGEFSEYEFAGAGSIARAGQYNLAPTTVCIEDEFVGRCFAGGLARSETGVLKSNSVAIFGGNYPYTSSETIISSSLGFAVASWFDVLVPNAGAWVGTITPTLSFSYDGSLSGSSPNPGASFEFQIGVIYIDRAAGTPDGVIVPVRMFTSRDSGNQGDPLPTGSVNVPNGAFSFDWQNGERVMLFSSLTTRATRSEGIIAPTEADFYNTGRVTGLSGISVGTFNSSSGTDWFTIGQNDDGGEVPEPGTYALLGAGLAFLAFRRATRRAL